MVTQRRSSCQDGDPEQPGKGPGGKQDEAAEQAGSQVMMMVILYIMMSVCVSVCHEKSSLPLQVCDFLSENVWVKIFFCEFFF